MTTGLLANERLAASRNNTCSFLLTGKNVYVTCRVVFECQLFGDLNTRSSDKIVYLIILFLIITFVIVGKFAAR